MKAYILLFCFCGMLSQEVFSFNDYSFEDEPTCRQDCKGLSGEEQKQCFKTFMEFYSYKLVKSSVYAGIWDIRFDNADLELFDRVYNQLLVKYNNPNILGNVLFNELNQTSQFVYQAFRPFSFKQDKGASVRYEFYPSLKCSVPCIYELHTWKTLFYISSIVFILALITVILYAISLRSQYESFKERLGNLKYASDIDS